MIGDDWIECTYNGKVKVSNKPPKETNKSSSEKKGTYGSNNTNTNKGSNINK